MGHVSSREVVHHENLVCIISGFSCQSSTLTHICWKEDQLARQSNGEDQESTYLSERAQTSKNTATNPGGVFAFGRGKDLYPHILDGKSLHLRKETIAKALGQCAAARQHNVGIEILPEVEISPVDRVNNYLMYTGVLESDNLWVEQDFGRPEPFRSNL